MPNAPVGASWSSQASGRHRTLVLKNLGGMVRGVLQLVMAKKEMRVQCPCCETELLIDALAHKVLRYKEKGSQAGVTWGVANQRLV